MTSDEYQFIRGQISAINGVLGAIMLCVPDQKSLLAMIEQITEGLIGVTTPTTLPEQFLEGQRQSINDLRQIASALTLPTAREASNQPPLPAA